MNPRIPITLTMDLEVRRLAEEMAEEDGLALSRFLEKLVRHEHAVRSDAHQQSIWTQLEAATHQLTVVTSRMQSMKAEERDAALAEKFGPISFPPFPSTEDLRRPAAPPPQSKVGPAKKKIEPLAKQVARKLRAPKPKGAP